MEAPKPTNQDVVVLGQWLRLNGSLEEKTLIIIKPHVLKSRLIIGTLISRFENLGLKLKQINTIKFTLADVKAFYPHLTEKPFFNQVVQMLTQGPAIAFILEGINAIFKAKKLCGPTDPLYAEPGTIRGDYATEIKFNLVHASENKEDFKKEFKIYNGLKGPLV